MLRLLSILPALAHGAAHGGCPEGRANINADNLSCPAGYVEDAAGTIAPAAATDAPAATKAPASPVTAAPVTAAPATAAPATAAPATAAPATAAPATAAPAGNTTGNGTNGTNSSRVLFEEFSMPILRVLGAHTTCACKLAPEAGNSTNATVEEATVTTAIEMTMELDISGMDTTQKKATGNAIAYGIHVTACKGVKDFWNSMAKCMMGVSNQPGMNFGMAMSVDAALVAASQPGCDTVADCYGGAAPSRRMAATTLTNKADFSVSAKSAAAGALISQAVTQLATAAADLQDASKMMAEVQTAMSRPAMAATLGNFTALIATAVGSATIAAAVTRTGAGAPAAPASNAYTAAVGSVFMVVAGALLM